MSKENLEQFMNQVAESEELKARIGDEIDAESLIALGVECGFEFTAEDLTTGAELSDGELDGIAGGLIDGHTLPVKKLMFRARGNAGFEVGVVGLEDAGGSSNVREHVRKNAERLKR